MDVLKAFIELDANKEAIKSLFISTNEPVRYSGLFPK